MNQEHIGINKQYFYDMPIDLFCVLNAQNKQILQVNLSFEYILGWKADELIGKSIDTFFNTETDKTNIDKALSKIKLGVHSLAFETEFRTKNNLLRWIDWKGYIDDEKQNIFMIGRDITTLKDTQKNLAQQLQRDQITGLNDRKAFLTRLQDELTQAARYHSSTAVIMIDIDHFRNYNEHFGMQKGDECLRQVATALKTCLRRKTDFLARFENDEFAVLLSHNNLEKAVKSAEYLRASLEKFAVRQHENEKHHPITISLGVAAISETAQKTVSPETLLTAAQRALRISQQRGGNQVNYAEEFNA